MTIDFFLMIAYVSSIILFLGTPGPVTVMVANTSAKNGIKAGLATIIGTNTASLILIAISFAIIQGVFVVNEGALSWLTLFGSLYLLYFSIEIIKDKIDLAIVRKQSTTRINKSYLRHGFMVGISNPKDILFFIGFFPLFFKISNDNYLSMLILTVIWIALDYSILSAYSVVFSKMTSNKIVNFVNKLSGSILLLVAIYAIFRMVNELLNY